MAEQEAATATIDKGLVGLVWLLGLGAIVVSVSLVVFDFLRTRIPDVYDRRRRVLPQRVMGIAMDDRRHEVPPAPSFKPFAWIRHCLTIRDESIVVTHGLDTVMLLRFYREMAQLTGALSLFVGVLLLPTYATASNKDLPDSDPLRVIGIRILSLSNVPAKNWRLYIVLVADVIITVFVLWRIAKEVAYLAAVRRDYRASEHPSNYTLIVQDIPATVATNGQLHQFWHSLFPSSLDSVKFIPHGTKLEHCRQEYWKAVKNRQRAEALVKNPTLRHRLISQVRQPFRSRTATQASNESQLKEPKLVIASSRTILTSPVNASSGEKQIQTQPPTQLLPIAQPSLGEGGKKSSGISSILASQYLRPAQLRNVANKVNPIDPFQNWISPENSVKYWEGKEREAFNRVDSFISRSDSIEIEKATRAAIVVMRSKQEATMVAQTNFSTSQMEWVVSHAPDPDAINWNMFGIGARMVLPRRLIALWLTTALILFWVIPTALIQSLANVQELSKVSAFSWLGFVNNLGPELSGFVEGLLPAMVLEAVMIIVPKFIRRFVLLQRIPSKVDVERDILKKMIAFLYFSHLIYVVLSGSILEYSDEFIQNPSNIVKILSTSIPEQGTFMMNVVLLAALVQTPISLLQPIRLCKRWFGMRRALTKRDREVVNNGDSTKDHFEEYAFGTIFTVLGVVYSTLSPILLFMVSVFFIISYTVQRFALIYTHTKEWEGFAALHDIALQGIMIGLVLKHTTMVGLMGLNGTGVLAGLEFACAGVVVALMVTYKSRMAPVLEHGALTDLAQLDEFDTLHRGISGAGSALSEERSLEIAQEAYRHPGLAPLESFEE